MRASSRSLMLMYFLPKRLFLLGSTLFVQIAPKGTWPEENNVSIRLSNIPIGNPRLNLALFLMLYLWVIHNPKTMSQPYLLATNQCPNWLTRTAIAAKTIIMTMLDIQMPKSKVFEPSSKPKTNPRTATTIKKSIFSFVVSNILQSLLFLWY